MSIWDNLPSKSWSEVEQAYSTWGGMEDKSWYIIEKGYQYSYPSVDSINISTAFVGLNYQLKVKATEVLDPELAGAATLPTGEPFSGTVTASFRGVDYALSYNASSGFFEGMIPAPSLSAWFEDAATFSGVVVAENSRGAIAEPYTVTVYKPVPEVVSVSINDCKVNETTQIHAQIQLGSIPASAEISAMDFPGTVSVVIFGKQFALTAAGGNAYQASIVAPGASSWGNPGHVYSGTVTASLGEAVGSAGASVRVREITPPTITGTKPLQDIFISNDCSPLFRWTVGDTESGVARVEVTLDTSPHRYPAEIVGGVAAWQMPVVASGAHTITAYCYDNDDNEASLSRTLTGFDLITDRTEADVTAARELNNIQLSDMTGIQKAQWALAVSRGKYNMADFNRVETAVAYLEGRMAEYGVNLGLVKKTDWQRTDKPTVSAMRRYLGNVADLADGFGQMSLPMYDYYEVFTEPLDPPSANWTSLDHEAANQIERTLTELERRIDWMELTDWYSVGHTHTWNDVMSSHPTWGSLEGSTWMQLELYPVDETRLRLPWDFKEVTE